MDTSTALPAAAAAFGISFAGRDRLTVALDYLQRDPRLAPAGQQATTQAVEQC